jgi:hypothetical protein
MSFLFSSFQKFKLWGSLETANLRNQSLCRLRPRDYSNISALKYGGHVQTREEGYCRNQGIMHQAALHVSLSRLKAGDAANMVTWPCWNSRSSKTLRQSTRPYRTPTSLSHPPSNLNTCLRRRLCRHSQLSCRHVFHPTCLMSLSADSRCGPRAVPAQVRDKGE